ncbi:MAG: hypothetical protein OXL33_05980 [Chloroflexota bacterium]|nr:hypothetical protein [Chloroflexota bacterium]
MITPSAALKGAPQVIPAPPERDPFLEFLPGRLRRSIPSPDDIEDFVDSLESFGAAANRSDTSWRFPAGTAPQKLQMVLDALADMCSRR